MFDRAGDVVPDTDTLLVDFLPKNESRPPVTFFLASLVDCCCSVTSFGTTRQPVGITSASVTSGLDLIAASHDKEPFEFMYTASGLLRVMR